MHIYLSGQSLDCTTDTVLDYTGNHIDLQECWRIQKVNKQKKTVHSLTYCLCKGDVKVQVQFFMPRVHSEPHRLLLMLQFYPLEVLEISHPEFGIPKHL